MGRTRNQNFFFMTHLEKRDVPDSITARYDRYDPIRSSGRMSKEQARICLGVTRTVFDRWCGDGRYAVQ